MHAAAAAALLLALTAAAAAAPPATGLPQAVAVLAPAAQAAGTLAADALAGHWEGAFSREGAVQLCALDVGADAAATYDIPELGLLAEPLEDCTLEDDGSLRLRCLYGTFDGLLHANGEITAVNAEWGPPVRLHLKRAVSAAPPITTRDAVVSIGDARLACTLMLPATHAPDVAVVLVHGSEVGTRASWEYRSRATLLARHGIAALVFDRRGEGGSSGESAGAATGPRLADLAGDVRGLVGWLAAQPELQRGSDGRPRSAESAPVSIGLLGASQGAWIAPLAAAEEPRVAFLVLLGAPAVSVHEQELQRVEFTLRAAGSSDADIEDALAFTRHMLATARGMAGSAEAGAASGAASDTGSASSTAWEALAAETAAARGAPWASVVQLPDAPADLIWFARNDVDPAPALRRLQRPVLAMWGERDELVPPSRNLEPLRALLAEAGNADVTLRVWPGADHGLELPPALSGDAWDWPHSSWVWARRAPGADALLLEWLAARAGPAAH